MKTAAILVVSATLVVAILLIVRHDIPSLAHSGVRSEDPMELPSGKPSAVRNSVPSARSHPQANAPTPIVPPTLPPASPASNDPVEQALAQGTVLDSEIRPITGGWTRVTIVQTPVQPRPVRVVETWDHHQRCVSREMFLADQVIVRLASDVDVPALAGILSDTGMSVRKSLGNRAVLVQLPDSSLRAMPRALEKLASHPEVVVAAEPDGVGFGGASPLPNDPLFGVQWGMRNIGQSEGTPGVDIKWIEFAELMPEVTRTTIAVLDSGLNFFHPDLQDIAWQNPGEIGGDGMDNDGNGQIDDVRGWDFVNNDNNPMDDHGHGSHVTGIIAAHRQNGTGIAGVLKGARIVVCKILNSSNSGTTSNLIAALAYARTLGEVKVMNLSLQNYPLSSSLHAELTECERAGIVLAICAGNQGGNNDVTPNYPSSYPHDNIIAVGNHDRHDTRWAGSFAPSNYGMESVDLFAPGREIYSTVLGTSYESFTGTSMSTPFVTAICAALKERNPALSPVQIKRRVLATVIPRDGYRDLCVAGGRLSAEFAILNVKTDETGPIVKINRRIRSAGVGRFRLTGTATDRSGVALVEVRGGRGGFEAAKGTRKWNAVVRYAKGPRTIVKVRARDERGNRSAVVRSTFARIDARP